LFNVEYKTHIKSLNYVNFPCIIYDVNLERKVFMFQKLEAVEKRYEELNKLISDPDVISRQNEWKNLMKEHSDLVDIVEKYREYKKVKEAMDEAKEMLSDRDLKELAEMQIEECKEKLPVLEEELKILLIPKDKDDDRNIICEIRGGAGGDEAALFAGTLFRMYSMYAERKHWKLEVLNENETELGGFKEISFMITGKGAYSRFKFESGVHRVQRVPDTESSGRIHTSTATVAVLPVVEDVEIEINPADVRMEVFRASGAGGQHVNKTSSAVRLIHEPTGIVAECQTERSQVQNREYAMRLLKSRIYEIEKRKQDEELASERKSQVGAGDRSEKIRTYNYPQGRITDHRIGLSIYQMENFLNGDLDEVIDSLIAYDRAEKLKGNQE
jgi:peptide chain release factor 1